MRGAGSRDRHQPQGFLGKVCTEALARVDADRSVEAESDVTARAQATPAPPPFADALAGPGVAVIAEVKRASPSRGHLADIPDAAGLAVAYAGGGAAAVSVLTEPAHFGGSLEDLVAVAAAVDVPVLRKDFVLDGYQVWQARAAGAAAVLLIAAALDDAGLTALQVVADQAGVDCLVEAHTAAEVERAVACHAAAATGRRLVLGINARDLSTLQVDRDHVARVRAAVELPQDAVVVAESGVEGPDDVVAYAGAGADAVLVGGHVATAADPAAAVAELVAAGSNVEG
jgi:indole-3-glycerol phosphate synthase